MIMAETELDMRWSSLLVLSQILGDFWSAHLDADDTGLYLSTR